MISNCGHDERGKYSGGKAGDQTGDEWCIKPWYNRPWTVVLRYPDRNVAEYIAKFAEEAALNEHIGYNQDDRYSFWKRLKEVGYQPSNIATDCNADCSAGVAAIVKAIGYVFGIDKLKSVSIYLYSGDMKAGLVNAGFEAITDATVLQSDKRLRRGDILLYEGHHVATNLTDGELAYMRNTISKGYKDSVKGGTDCADLQKSLNYIGVRDNDGNALSTDGSCGARTVQAILNFQSSRGLDTDGRFGPKCWTALTAELDAPRIAVGDINIKAGTYEYDAVKDGYFHLTDYDVWVLPL